MRGWRGSSDGTAALATECIDHEDLRASRRERKNHGLFGVRSAGSARENRNSAAGDPDGPLRPAGA